MTSQTRHSVDEETSALRPLWRKAAHFENNRIRLVDLHRELLRAYKKTGGDPLVIALRAFINEPSRYGIRHNPQTVSQYVQNMLLSIFRLTGDRAIGQFLVEKVYEKSALSDKAWKKWDTVLQRKPEAYHVLRKMISRLPPSGPDLETESPRRATVRAPKDIFDAFKRRGSLKELLDEYKQNRLVMTIQQKKRMEVDYGGKISKARRKPRA